MPPQEIDMEGEDIEGQTAPSNEWDDYFNQWYSEYRPEEAMQPDSSISPAPVVAVEALQNPPDAADIELEAPPVNQSISVEGQGLNYSPQKTAQIKQNFRGPLDAAIAGEAESAVGQFNQEVSDLDRIRTLNVQNLQDRQKLEEQIAGEKTRLANDEVDLQKELRFQEQAGINKARMAEEAALNNWVGAVKAYEATNINPGKLWGDMSPGGRFATAVSVFAGGLLTARGVDNNILQNVNKMIDDSINAQVANLNKKGRVADQFHQIWSGVRAQSESDAEARSKMRMLMTSEFKSAVVARLSSFDSDLARLRAQEAYALLEGDLVQQVGKLRQQMRENFEKGRNFDLDRWYKDNMLRLERGRLGIAQKELDLKNRPVADLDITPPEQLVRDPLTGDVVMAVADKEERKDVQKAWNAMSNDEKSATRLQELARSLGSIYDGIGSGKVTSKEKAELKSIYKELQFNKAVKLSGLTITDAQLEQLDKIQGGLDTWSKDIFSDLTTINTLASQQLRDIEAVKTDLRTRGYAVNDLTKLKYRGDVPEAVNAPGITAPAARQSAAKKSDDVTSADKDIGTTEAEFRISNDNVYEPGEETITAYINAGFEPRYSTSSGKPANSKYPDIGASVPAWADSASDLAEIVKNRSESPEARTAALNQLKKLRSDWVNASPLRKSATENTGLMSSYLLNELEAGGWTANERIKDLPLEEVEAAATTKSVEESRQPRPYLRIPQTNKR